MKTDMDVQYYKGVPLKLINRHDYKSKKAKRFTINHTNQNVWIPNKHLHEDGTIRSDANIDYVLHQSQRQLEIAGVNIVFEVTNRKGGAN